MGQLNILISGAGVAGNAMAFWLSRLGHNVTVVEQAPCLRTGGLQVGLRAQGAEVMKLMGIEQAVRAKKASEQGLQFVDSSGRRRGYFPANTSDEGPRTFTTEFEIMRGDLCQIIYDRAKDKARYLFGNSIETYVEKDTFVEVQFTDGSVEQFDLLVGADGLGSHTRKLMLESGSGSGSEEVEDPFHPLGQHIAYFTVPLPVEEDEKDENLATVYIAPGGRFVLTRRHSPNQLQVYLPSKAVCERMKDVPKGDILGQKQAFADVYRGSGWKVDAIVDLLLETDDFYCQRLAMIRLNSWSKRRVVLVGDAACCPSASTGMGTTNAIVGAYVLAGEIAKQCANPNPDVAIALELYEQRLRPFVDLVHERALEPTILEKMPWNRFTISMMYGLLWLVSWFKFDFGGEQERKLNGWKLPVYDELDATPY